MQNIRFFENEETLGYDGNLHSLFASSRRGHRVMKGNDYLLCPRSLHTIGGLLELVTVLKNISIGAGSSIGLQSVVTRDSPSSMIAAGGSALSLKRFFRCNHRWLKMDESQ